ncbi:unnamed protein product [Caretta caretta]
MNFFPFTATTQTSGGTSFEGRVSSKVLHLAKWLNKTKIPATFDAALTSCESPPQQLLSAITSLGKSVGAA